jgi:prolyl-tRNA synthetase
MIQKQSQLVSKTTKEKPKDEVSVNAELLLRAGFVDKLVAGVYSYLPLGLRVLDKIKNIIRSEMRVLGAQEILMPALTPRENWVKTGRWDGFDVLFKLKGEGDKDYALAATHEEVVTPLVRKFVRSYRDLPVAVYQIQDKFRNEPRAKSGLLRGREFSMKDLYSFHADEADLDAYYEKVKIAYRNIYERLGLGASTHVTFASGGTFSRFSHEYQTVCDAGEDLIYVCPDCATAVNKEILVEQPNCPGCGNEKLEEKKAIEVGNIFKLQTKYSTAFDFTYSDEKGAVNPVVMGCYGIGPSRIMGAIVETHHDAAGIIWPRNVAPYEIHLLAFGGDEILAEAGLIADALTANFEILFDDRDANFGEKLVDADLIGLPTRIIVSAKTLKVASVEIKDRNAAESEVVKIDQLNAYLSAKRN